MTDEEVLVAAANDEETTDDNDDAMESEAEESDDDVGSVTEAEAVDIIDDIVSEEVASLIGPDVGEVRSGVPAVLKLLAEVTEGEEIDGVVIGDAIVGMELDVDA